ncbi:uncharacterized protein LOC144447803 [Glandiceps talaboti]
MKTLKNLRISTIFVVLVITMFLILIHQNKLNSENTQAMEERYGSGRHQERKGKKQQIQESTIMSTKEERKATLPIVQAISDEADKSVTDNKAQSTKSRYLLPMKTLQGGGTNRQYFIFENAVMLALLTKRSLVQMPFFLHGGHTYGFSMEHMRDFNTTFDLSSVKELLPLATIEEYVNTCKPENTKIITWGNTEKYESTRTKMLRDKIGIELEGVDKVMKLDDEMGLEEFQILTDGAQCLVYFAIDRFRLEIDQLTSQSLKDDITEHLVRTPRVRKIVDDISHDICNGDPYLALHWRNKTSERPCNGKVKTECQDILREASYFADITGSEIFNLMKKYKLKCLYVACPLWSLKIIDHLAKRIPRDHIFISANLTTGRTENQDYFDDYYYLALIEQEIVYRAQVFVSAGSSNWSNFVVLLRELTGRTTFNIRDLPGMPTNNTYRVII